MQPDIEYELFAVLQQDAIAQYRQPTFFRLLSGLGIFPITKDNLAGATPRFRYIPKRWPELWQSFVDRNAQPTTFDSAAIEALGFSVVPNDDTRPCAVFSLAGTDGNRAVIHGEFFNHHGKLFLFQRDSGWTLLEQQLLWVT